MKKYSFVAQNVKTNKNSKAFAKKVVRVSPAHRLLDDECASKELKLNNDIIYENIKEAVNFYKKLPKDVRNQYRFIIERDAENHEKAGCYRDITRFIVMSCMSKKHYEFGKELIFDLLCNDLKFSAETNLPSKPNDDVKWFDGTSFRELKNVRPATEKEAAKFIPFQEKEVNTGKTCDTEFKFVYEKPTILAQSDEPVLVNTWCENKYGFWDKVKRVFKIRNPFNLD